jgi:serpin B
LANAAWVQKGMGLLPNYQRTIRQHFGSPIETVDFAKNSSQAIATINQWVFNLTKGKIKDLLSSQDVSDSTRLVLTSAVYLKAQWLSPFDDGLTKSESFHVNKKDSQDVQMMQINKGFPLYVDNNVSVIELPYANASGKGPQLVMVIALPKDATHLDQIEENLSLSQWKNWIEQMRIKQVELSMPKFKIQTRMDLNDTMKALGMKLAFTPNANFSGITGNSDLYINKAVHQTFINVDEKGTEAAAATAISMNLTSAPDPEPPYVFKADHPFIYVIMDRSTGTILFMGRLSKP